MSAPVSTVTPGLSDQNLFTNIYIKNFGFELTSEQLRKMFDRFGEIKSSKIMTDEEGNSRGFGFVCFNCPESAATAVAEMHGMKMSPGRILYVAKALKKAERMHVLKYRREYEKNNLYVKNLDDSMNEDSMYNLFSPFGKITSLKLMVNEIGIPKGYGFVAFETPSAASRASYSMNGRMVGTKPLYVTFAQRRPERYENLSESRDVNCDVVKDITPNSQYGNNAKLQHAAPPRKPTVENKFDCEEIVQPESVAEGEDPVVKRVDAQISINLQRTYLANQSGAMHTINIERSMVETESVSVCPEPQVEPIPDVKAFTSKCWGDDTSDDENDANGNKNDVEESDVALTEYEFFANSIPNHNFNERRKFNASSNRAAFNGYPSRAFNKSGSTQGNAMKPITYNNNRFSTSSSNRRFYNNNNNTNNSVQSTRYSGYNQGNRFVSNRGAGDNKDPSTVLKAVSGGTSDQSNNHYKTPFNNRNRDNGNNNRNSYGYANNTCNDRNNNGLSNNGNRANSQYGGRNYGGQMGKNYYKPQQNNSRHYENNGNSYNQSRFDLNSRSNNTNQLQNRGYGQQNRNFGQNRFNSQSQQNFNKPQGQYDDNNNYNNNYNGSKQRSRFTNNNNRFRSQGQNSYGLDNSKPMGSEEAKYRNKNSSVNFINTQ